MVASADIQNCLQWRDKRTPLPHAKDPSGPYFWFCLTQALRKCHFSVEFFKTFTGEISTEKVFPTISSSSLHERIFMFDLEIQANTKDITSLSQGIDKLLSPRFESHQLVDGGFSDIHVKSNITRLPQILLIHLNRTIVNWDLSSDRTQTTKSSHVVETPNQFKFLDQSFDIYGKIIYHPKEERHSAQIRLNATDEWYSIMDESVEKICEAGQFPNLPENDDFIEFVLYRKSGLEKMTVVDPPELSSKISNVIVE